MFPIWQMWVHDWLLTIMMPKMAVWREKSNTLCVFANSQHAYFLLLKYCVCVGKGGGGGREVLKSSL